MFATLKVLNYIVRQKSLPLHCVARAFFYARNVLVIYGGFHYPCIHCNGVCEPHDKDF